MIWSGPLTILSYYYRARFFSASLWWRIDLSPFWAVQLPLDPPLFFLASFFLVIVFLFLWYGVLFLPFFRFLPGPSAKLLAIGNEVPPIKTTPGLKERNETVHTNHSLGINQEKNKGKKQRNKQ